MIIYVPLTRWRKIAEIKQRYKAVLGRNLDLKHPQTFNEKIQWLKLNYKDTRAVRGADKSTARDMVAEIIGEKYLIPLFGVYDSVSEIDWESLPNKFVIKISDGYNQHIICTNKVKFDVERAVTKINNWLKPTARIYWRSGSYPGQYRKSKPRILIEEFIGAKDNKIHEYKFLYLSGKLAFILAPTERQLNNSQNVKLTHYDKNWKQLNLVRKSYETAKNGVPQPRNLSKMLELSRMLAQDFPICRVDLYETRDGIKFGELTFTPYDGYIQYEPEEWNLRLGEMIDLPNQNDFKLVEMKPIEIFPRAWLKDRIKILNKSTTINVKRFIKALLPYGLVVLRRRLNNNYNSKPKDDQKNINIKFLGSLSDDEVLSTMRQEGAHIHFGQSAEDGVLSRIFRGKRDGFYVDIGAFHPTKYSNTFLFHNFLGWRGINIDANKYSIDALNVARPNDININVAIGKTEGIQELTIYSDQARNTLSDANRERQNKKGDVSVVRTEKVKVRKLKIVLDEHLPEGVNIDVLNIDIEGFDIQALKTNDWSKYRPKVILIEDYTINTKGFEESEIYKYMKKLKYKFFSHTYDTSIYVDTKEGI